MLIDLAVFTNRATKIRKIATVLVRGIQLGVVHTSRQACTPDEEGVLSYQILNNLAKLKIWKARKPREEEDHLAV